MAALTANPALLRPHPPPAAAPTDDLPKPRRPPWHDATRAGLSLVDNSQPFSNQSSARPNRRKKTSSIPQIQLCTSPQSSLTVATVLGAGELVESRDGVLSSLGRRLGVDSSHEAAVDNSERVPRTSRRDVLGSSTGSTLLNSGLVPRLETSHIRHDQPVASTTTDMLVGLTLISSRSDIWTSPRVVKPVTFLPSIRCLPLERSRLTKMAPP